MPDTVSPLRPSSREAWRVPIRARRGAAIDLTEATALLAATGGESPANDLGGTLREQTVLRMAVSGQGSAKPVAEVQQIGRRIDRTVVQRTRPTGQLLTSAGSAFDPRR
jgi:hypothetical protein